MHTPQVSAAATAVHRDRGQPRHQQPSQDQQHADPGRTQPEDGADQPADRRGWRVHGTHNAQLGSPVAFHDRDGKHCHHDDREPAAGMHQMPAACCSPAPRSQHRRTQPRRSLADRAFREPPRWSLQPSGSPPARGPARCPRPSAEAMGAVRKAIALTRPSWPPLTSANNTQDSPGNPDSGQSRQSRPSRSPVTNGTGVLTNTNGARNRRSARHADHGALAVVTGDGYRL